ncbi:CBS domain-containing protein, partial [Acinetobacter baumannii]
SGMETIYAIYLTDPETGALSGVVSLRELLMADPLSVLSRIALVKKPVTVRPEADREEAARLISKYDLLAVPVIDDKNRIIGIVT